MIAKYLLQKTEEVTFSQWIHKLKKPTHKDFYNQIWNYIKFPLHISILQNNFDKFKFFVKSFPSSRINYQDKWGMTPLHLVVERKLFNFFEVLLEKKVDLTKISKSGSSVLHRAVWGGSFKIVKKIIESIPKNILKNFINLKNKIGETAINIAEKQINSISTLEISTKEKNKINNEYNGILYHLNIHKG